MMRHAIRQLWLGMLALFIVMAIGRFAYTPILPFMQVSEHMDSAQAGFLATINYLGYLIGAIIPMYFIFKSKAIDLKIYLIINIMATILMGVTESYGLWSMLRLVSGITSGTVFVLASNIVLEALRQAQKSNISGLLYSGVGLGIFTSSIYIFFETHNDSWQLTWIVLGVVSLLGGMFVIFGMRDNPTIKIDQTQHAKIEDRQPLNAKFIRYFSIAYFCEGAGYIITGTFLVAIVKSIPELADYAALSWMFVGLGAIPSTVMWSVIAEKIGYDKATYCAFVLQIIGVSLPILSNHTLILMISSILFGSTFLGLTTLFMSTGQKLMYQSGGKSNLVASLTVIYSVGQMVAPAISGVLIGASNNYNIALAFATLVLIIGLFSTMKSYKVLN
ncbi:MULTISPECIES: YbfB/YjiJ family MFS transporter [Staphylococcus]|uniref:MFS transporter n=1 Tax=Staphylococcus arlettae TaxID=29378 RepID=A0A380BYS9_9STAP|nr:MULTISPECIES: YbfB/YjiJ family MFS transporter [Staphylococcus]ERF48336.1 MFS transporter permease [Staphylococcus sp. EGD-HP3]MBF0737066.1 YbfB/YjiJ family MFS transporter [Staphylococcus arlettae]MCD8817054.1 YbfB/YjiJ family MFS transporter [Staphylococcus arlettae]MCD8835153.1 YbfB/YjiJ family MFS transporter [Staphylococcus arlettae]MCP8714912.1 YbfB/YjiJ family MFS transporter [Staphylococcus arlettae]